MAWGFLNSVRDVFDSNTKEDQRKRLARGESRLYGEQQKASGKNGFDKTFSFLGDVAQGKTAVQKGTRDFTIEAGRSIAKVPEQIVKSGAEFGTRVGAKIMGVSYEEALNSLPDWAKGVPQTGQVNDPIRKFVYGSKPVETYQKRQEGYTKALESKESVLNVFGDKGANIGQKFATPLSLLGIGLTVGSDVTGGGKKEAGEKVVQGLAKETTEQGVKKLLKGKLAQNVIEDVARAIASTGDENIVKNILARATNTPTNVRSGESILGNLGLRGAQAPPMLPSAATATTTSAPVQDIVSATVPKIPITSKQTPIDDPFKRISEVVTGKPAVQGQISEKGIADLRKEQNQLNTQERGKRFTTVSKLGESEFGDAGYYKRRGALKGEYAKVENAYADRFTPEESQQLFVGAQKKIYSTPDSVYERDWKQHGLNKPLHASAAKFNTEVAVRKVLGLEPGLPTDSELRLLKIHSPKLAEDIIANTPKNRKLFDLASDIASSSRALKSGIDLSMGGRQGLFVAARHPIQWASANIKSAKFAKDEKYFFSRMKELADDPWIMAGNSHDIGLQGVKGLTDEAYNNADLAGKVPGVRRAERAYTGGLSELRASLWKNNLQRYGKTPEEAIAKLGEKGMEGLAETVRTLTGRGGKSGGFIEKRAKTLGEALFSPRLWASRLQPFNPAYWKRIGSAGRKEAFESLGAFAAVAATVLEAAHLAGAEVETDARSSDFLKVKVGDTRYDILGGFQQNLVFGWRQLTGERKSSQSGKVTTFARDIGDVIAGRKEENVVDKGPYTGNRLTAAADLFSNKAAPIPAAGMRLLAGEDKAGNNINPLNEIGQLFVPIGIQNAFNARRSPEEVAKGLPEFVGVGSQTYGLKDIKLTEGQTKYVAKLKSKNASPEQIEATERFYQYQKTAPDKDAASKKIKEALAKDDLPKAIKLAKDYNQKYKDGFVDWKKRYGKYGKEEQLNKDYRSKLITDESIDRYIQIIEKERGQ